MTKDNAKKCGNYALCKLRELIPIGKKLKEANYRFIKIHCQTSDVLLSHQMMLNCCRENEQLFKEFDRIVSEIAGFR